MTSARLAPQADVGAETIDEPGVATARMASPKADHIAQEQRKDGRLGHRAGRVSKARPAMRRHE